MDATARSGWGWWRCAAEFRGEGVGEERRWVEYVVYFFFNDTATTEIYTLSLHDALPIYLSKCSTPQLTIKVEDLMTIVCHSSYTLYHKHRISCENVS